MAKGQAIQMTLRSPMPFPSIIPTSAMTCAEEAVTSAVLTFNLNGPKLLNSVIAAKTHGGSLKSG